MEPRIRAALLLILASAANLLLIYLVVAARSPPERWTVIALSFIAMGLAWGGGHLIENRRGRFARFIAAVAILEFPALALYVWAGWDFLGALPMPLAMGAAVVAALAGAGASVVFATRNLLAEGA